MTENQNDDNTQGLPPRSKVHGRKRKAVKGKRTGSAAPHNQYDDAEQIQTDKTEAVDEIREESDHSWPNKESTSYPLYRRPERKKNDHFLVKIWLALFLLIVIMMVSYPIWQEWL